MSVQSDPSPLWNQTQRAYPDEQCIHQLFEKQVARTPDAVAVTGEDQQLSYLQLNERANQLAHHLRAMGVGPDVLVGLCLELCPEALVALLAVLKAGGAYLPLDVTYPTDRLAFMLQDSCSRVVISSSQYTTRLGDGSHRLVLLDQDVGQIGRGAVANPESTGGPRDLAYVMYTSGSTGQPKGVMVEHRGVVSLIDYLAEALHITNRDVALAISTYCFDISVLELFLPLACGARVRMATSVDARDMGALKQRIAATSPTLLQMTPTRWRMLLDSGWKGCPSARLLTGGEACLPDLAQRLLSCGQELWNLYGPTETTVYSTAHSVQREDVATVPIGRAVANTRVYVLDEQRRQLPVGATGEIYIGGVGVARGYLNRPELTAERFVPDPFAAEQGGCLYRTGDLGRYRADGAIEYLGRSDDQVKIRGYRIEPGEVESALCQHPAVRQAVVVACGEGAGRRLVAYLVCAHGHDQPTVEDLRSWLLARLADYMIPSGFVMLDALPMTPSGKVNRKALPAPEASRPRLRQSYVAPRSDTEEVLAGIWMQILGLDKVGIEDDFADLGGDSLQAVELSAHIEQRTGVVLPLASPFQSPTIAAMALAVTGETARSIASPLVCLHRGGRESTIFLFPGAGGHSLGLRNLARRLGGDCSVYGLNARGLDGKAAPHRTVEEMAGYFLRNIRSVQPHGPYQLVGFCVGGVVAWELAQQLLGEGEEVRFLGLLDTFAPGYPPAWVRIRRHLHAVRSRSPIAAAAYVGGRLRLRAQRILKQPSSATGMEGTIARAIGEVKRTMLKAVESYRPQPYSGRVTIVRAESDAPDYVGNGFANPAAGWGALALGGVDISIIGSDHSGLVEDRGVEALAGELRLSLAAVGRENMVDIADRQSTGSAWCG